MNVKSDRCGSTQEKPERVQRSSPLDAERNRADAHGPCLDSKDENVGRLDGGESAPVWRTTWGRGGLVTPTFVSASRVTQVSPCASFSKSNCWPSLSLMT